MNLHPSVMQRNATETFTFTQAALSNAATEERMIYITTTPSAQSQSKPVGVT